MGLCLSTDLIDEQGLELEGIQEVVDFVADPYPEEGRYSEYASPADPFFDPLF